MNKRDKLRVINRAMRDLCARHNYSCFALEGAARKLGLGSGCDLSAEYADIFLPDGRRIGETWVFNYEDGGAAISGELDDAELLGVRLTALALFRAMVEAGDA